MKKKVVSVLLVLLFCFISAGAIDIVFDGHPLPEVEPVIQDNYTMIPFRDMFEALGATVEWDAATQTVSAHNSYSDIFLRIGAKEVKIGEDSFPLPIIMGSDTLPIEVPAMLLNGRTMIPLSSLGKILQTRVLWSNDKDTIFLLPPYYKNLTVEYIDVGQGDSILLSCGGESMLIDAGQNGEQVLEYLYGARKNQLDYVVATHPDADHIGGMGEVLTWMPTKRVMLANALSNTRAFGNMLDAIESRRLTPIIPQKGEVYPLGDAKITVISSETGSSSNNSSLVLKAEYGNTSFLFTGDAEEPLERSIVNNGTDIKCDVLKVAHHGSKTSTSDAFLAAAAPKTAIISCGRSNAYGYPSEEVLNKLSKIPIWRTDMYGNLVVISNGSTYEVIANNPPLDLQSSVRYPEYSNREWYMEPGIFEYDIPWEESATPTAPTDPTVPATPSAPMVPATSATPSAPTVPATPSAPTVPAAPTVPSLSTSQPAQPILTDASNMVYITDTGNRYHYDPHCNGGTYYLATREAAQGKGLTPCNKCVNPQPKVTSTSESIPHFHPTEPEERKIYITKTGKRYHYDPHCNGGTYYESTLEEAKSRGLTPCQKCVLK